jgi:heat shock protein HtpX
VVGYVLGLVISNGSTTAAIGALVIALLLSLAMSWSSYKYGDRIVLATSHARPVTAEEEPRLHNVVEGLALAAGLPKPAVYVVPEQSPNAFATGRDPARRSR